MYLMGAKKMNCSPHKAAKNVHGLAPLPIIFTRLLALCSLMSPRCDRPKLYLVIKHRTSRVSCDDQRDV